MLGKRTTGLFIAASFLIICFFTFPSFASNAAEQVEAMPPDGPTASATDSAVKIEPPTETNNVSGSAVNLDASSTTGTAVNLATPSTTGAALGVNTPTTPGAINAEKAEDDESLWYSSKIPMKKEHQKLLWDYCKKRGINYIDMLALISLESGFSEKCAHGKCKGYFQISTVHGKNLSKTLKTLNKPLDGVISINWGTAMYSWILADKRVKNLEGKKQRDVALSIFSLGSNGYNKHGINKSFLTKYYKKRSIIESYFKKE